MKRYINFSKKIITIAAITIAALSCKKPLSVNIQQVIVDSLTHQNLHDIVFINKDTGVIVGGLKYSNGQMLITYNAGSTWHLKDSLSAWGLFGACVDSKKNMYAVGITGKILSSNNSGTTWNTLQTNEWQDLEKIAFVSDTIAVAIGSGKVLQRLTNHTWQPQIFTRQLNAVQFVNNTTGFVAAFGAIYKTTNAGESWEILAAKGDNFNGIFFLDAQTGFVIGSEGTILKTNNAGESWRTIRNGNSLVNANWQFTDIAFVDVNKGYICGKNGLLLLTTDGGNTWKKVDYFSGVAIRKVYVQASNKVWLVGDNATVFKIEE
ncbi:MAG: hypothetical protein RIQ33_321 [Bacteroidota bacterium]